MRSGSDEIVPSAWRSPLTCAYVRELSFRRAHGEARLDEVIAAAAGEALPQSIIGLVAPFFFRRSRAGSIAAGAIGAISLPLLMSLSGVSQSNPAVFFMSIGYGAFAGWIWYLASRSKA